MIRFDNVVFWFTAGVKDIDRYHEKLTLSLYSSALPPHLDKVKLGVISKEDLPLHYTYVKTVKWVLTRLSQTSCCWWFPPLFQPGWKGGRRQQRDTWEAFGELSWFVQPFKCGLPPGKAGYKWHTNAFTNEGLAEVRVFGCYFIHRFLGVYSVKLFFCLYTVNASKKMILQQLFGRNSLYPGPWNGLFPWFFIIFHEINIFLL